MSINNCAHCDHKRNPDGGWCYMFRVEPKGPCAQHTIRTEAARGSRLQTAFMLLDRMKANRRTP